MWYFRVLSYGKYDLVIESLSTTLDLNKKVNYKNCSRDSIIGKIENKRSNIHFQLQLYQIVSHQHNSMQKKIE